jgi:choline dehydrogenase-like flavoprotein
MSKSLVIDLAGATEVAQSVTCDVCIVGAGAAGIYLGNRLATGGLDVVLVEAGGTVCGSFAEVGFHADFAEEPYPGATQGRFFGVGGTTSRWGGLLFPHSALDVREPSDFDPDQWPAVVEVVNQHGGAVLEQLGYTHEGDFWGFAQKALGCISPALIGAGLQPAASLFIPFRKRNFATQLGQGLAATQRVRVFANAVVNGWTMREDELATQRIASLCAVSPNERTLSVKAERFVIAAGTIESTRLLLELDSQFSRRITRSTAAVGAYMSDHLSCTVADTDASDVNKAVRLLAPRFQRGWMRSLRFMETSPPPGTVRAFAHFVFEHSSSGFNVVREVLSGLQSRKLPHLTPGDLVTGLIGGLALAWGRYARNVLHIAKGTKSRLLLDTEQIPVKENRIALGASIDRFGRRNPVIHWTITPRDLENMATIGSRMVDTWNRSSLDLPRLVPRDLHWDSSRPYDTFHPVGTCRMGLDDEAVVSPELQVHGVDNLWVTSTAVLPTAGTANPTYTLLCLAHGLSERLTSG